MGIMTPLSRELRERLEAIDPAAGIARPRRPDVEEILAGDATLDSVAAQQTTLDIPDKPVPRHRVALTVAAVAVVAAIAGTGAVLIGDHGQHSQRLEGAATNSASVTPTVHADAHPTKRASSLPPVVNGVPVAALASQALHLAKGWGDPHPENVRVVLTTGAGFERVVGEQGGGTATPVYAVVLDGRFECGAKCGISELPEVSDPVSSESRSSATRHIAASHLAFTVSPRTVRYAGSLYAGRIDPDLSRLGHVIDLQPYIEAAQ